MVTINLTDDNSDAAKYKFLSGLAHKNGQKIIIIKKVKGIIYIKNFNGKKSPDYFRENIQDRIYQSSYKCKRILLNNTN